MCLNTQWQCIALFVYRIVRNKAAEKAKNSTGSQSAPSPVQTTTPSVITPATTPNAGYTIMGILGPGGAISPTDPSQKRKREEGMWTLSTNKYTDVFSWAAAMGNFEKPFFF